jgi:chitin synthase
MIFIIVGSASRILNSSIISPSSLILFSLVVVFLIAAICHPREFKCLFPGILYFIALPSAFILLNIYAVINLNNVSWGTRETKPSNSLNEERSNLNKSKNKNHFAKYFKSLFKSNIEKESVNSNQDIIIQNINDYLENIEQKLRVLTNAIDSTTKNEKKENMQIVVERVDKASSTENEYDTLTDYLPPIKSWIDDDCLNNFKLDHLNKNESEFFQNLIQRYLYPIVESQAKKEQVIDDLKSLRNNCCFSFLMFNAFWIVLIFTLQLLKDKLRDKIYIRISLDNKNENMHEPVGFIYVMIFVIVMFIQFFAMLWHRSITFIQLIRKTNLTNIVNKAKLLAPKRKKINKISKNKTSNIIKMQSLDNIAFEVNQTYDISDPSEDVSDKITNSKSTSDSTLSNINADIVFGYDKNKYERKLNRETNSFNDHENKNNSDNDIWQL